MSPPGPPPRVPWLAGSLPLLLPPISTAFPLPNCLWAQAARAKAARAAEVLAKAQVVDAVLPSADAAKAAPPADAVAAARLLMTTAGVAPLGATIAGADGPAGDVRADAASLGMPLGVAAAHAAGLGMPVGVVFPLPSSPSKLLPSWGCLEHPPPRPSRPRAQVPILRLLEGPDPHHPPLLRPR